MSKEYSENTTGNVNTITIADQSSTLADNNKDRKRQQLSQQNQQKHTEVLSDPILSKSNQNDLTHSTTSKNSTNGKTYHQTSTAAPGAVSSPNSSPSKSRNKKKNDAKRRSKKQQQQQTTRLDQQQANEPGPDTGKSRSSSVIQDQNSSDGSPRKSLCPSPKKNQNKQQQPKQSNTKMDEISRTNVKQDTHSDDDKISEPTNNRPLETSDECGQNSTEQNTATAPIAINNSNNNNQDQQQQPLPPPPPPPQKGSEPSSVIDSNSWRRKQRENRELREQIKLRDAQLRELVDRVKQQMHRTHEVEVSLVNTTKTCSQFEKLLQQELTNRSRLESENEGLNQTLTRLRNQLSALEKEKSTNNELIRVLNATLMERETEVSILKLKMTRLQTNSSHVNMSQFNPPSNSSLAKKDPCKAFTMAGRSNSEFSRNTKARSTMMAEAISARSSTSQLQQYNSTKEEDRDASVWATVPEELTPSKRPMLLERNLPNVYDQCHTANGIYGNESSSSPLKIGHHTSTPISRDRRYRTLPRSMKNPIKNEHDEVTSSNSIVNGVQSVACALQVAKQQHQSETFQSAAKCIVTNLDDSNNTSRSSGGNKSSSEMTPLPDTLGESNKTTNISSEPNFDTTGLPNVTDEKAKAKLSDVEISKPSHSKDETSSQRKQGDISHHSNTSTSQQSHEPIKLEKTIAPPHLPTPSKSPSTPVKISSSFKKIFHKFKRSDSSTSGKSKSQSKTELNSDEPELVITAPLTPVSKPFQRGAARSTLVGPPTLPSNIRAQVSPQKAIDFQTDKPFAEWDTDMLVDWLTMIGLSMYANQCRRWVKCGAHIMNATPAEVDKGLEIKNHLHRKKLRLAISELNGDCDKITKAAAKLDYLWVARWLDDIGLPQHKEAFINARVDGRVLNYLTVEDLVSLEVKSLLHHSSIRCGIKVLRSINFDLQLLKRRATAKEIEQMNSMRQNIDERKSINTSMPQGDISGEQHSIRANDDETNVPLWTCHRVMEWLRMIDFAEFAPNLRGSGVHGGLIMYEDGFNIDTVSILLSIPTSRTLLRRHLSTFFENLIGSELAQRKKQYKEQSSNQHLNPASEIKTSKKTPLWFGKLKSSKVGQDGMDEYLCPMYPMEPQIVKTTPMKKAEPSSTTMHRDGPSSLSIIPESINV